MSLRQLPSVDRLLQHPRSKLLLETFGREAVLRSLRHTLDQVRAGVLAGEGEVPSPEQLVQEISHILEARFALSLRPVINATGVILHTNLGRAPLSQAAVQAVMDTASGYSNLEFNVADGKRGKRHDHIEQLTAEVIGAEAAMVVNNCAAALLLILSALAEGREVIISRGQLVEIGGGFRIPEVMAQSGVRLVEVGTTNRTRIADYERGIAGNTAALMRAHSSNFKMLGFVENTPLAELAALAQERSLLCLDDLGSGALLDTAAFGLAHEPTVQESLTAGADVVTFSGDKLLGGPQAGIIVGKKAVLDVLKKHPLARALRVDKMTIAALAATLDHYRRGRALQDIPIWQMISQSLEQIAQIAETWQAAVDGDLLPGESTIGGGSLPGETLPTLLFAPKTGSPADVQVRLRQYNPPIIARVKDDRVLLDPRTVLPEQVATVTAALKTM